jgi:predicted AlkP superfamily phosphohydrolase/phosphomutase
MLTLLQLDAVALPVVERLLGEGRLPTLAELRRHGQWETIDARATILQSATYPTLCTGMDVRDHGLYTTFPWSAADQRARFMHTLPKPPTIWERLTPAGRRCLIVDPYLGWPPQSMAGVYLSGWQFQDRFVMPGRSLPRQKLGALSRRYGRPPRLDDVYGTPRPSDLHALRDHLLAAPRRTTAAATELLTEGPFDLVWINFSSAHRAGHQLWNAAAVMDDSSADAVGQELRAGLDDVYVAVDTAVGRLIDVLPQNADLLVFSPTGMGPNLSRADLLPDMLNAVLAGEGPTVGNGGIQRSPVWALRSRIPTAWRSRMARALPDRLVLDLTTRLYSRGNWERMRAIAVPGENKGYIRLNLKGRERDGTVDPAEADELMSEIARGLLTFSDIDGSPSVVSVERMSDIAGGPSYAPELPDLVVSWGEAPPAHLARVSSPAHGEVIRHGVGSGRSGNHTDDAWMILLPGTSRVRDPGRPVTIMDIGATACTLLGGDVAGLSGEPLLET